MNSSLNSIRYKNEITTNKMATILFIIGFSKIIAKGKQRSRPNREKEPPTTSI